VDQGTQSTRVYLFDRDVQPVASHQVSFPQMYPQPGWCEHDPFEIWLTVKECLTKALQDAEARIGPVVIKALGITNQRETTVVWHRQTGRPLYNAVVWLDTRTRELCGRMEQELGSKDYFRPVTGLPISTYFSGFKFAWMYENVPAVKAAVDEDMACFGTIDSWLIWQLTGGPQGGVHVTDVTNASRTMLMDLSSCTWHQPYLPLFHMRPSCLPKIVSNAEVYGHTADLHGALHNIPISGCLGDQMAALLGQRCVEGEAKNTYGTGCFMLLNTGPKAIQSRHGLLTTTSFKLGPEEPMQYALEGAVAVAGLGISWMCDSMGIATDPTEFENLANSVPDTGGVYIVPAFSGLLAPHWDDTARGAILGLTGFSTKAHLARAMLEAIAWQAREVLDAMRADIGHGKEDAAAAAAGWSTGSGSGAGPSVDTGNRVSGGGSGNSLRVLRVDGGAAKNGLLMQLQADVLQVPVVRPNFQETTVLGAALAAGLGANVWTKEQIFAALSYSNTEFRPSITAADADKRYTHWKKAVSRSLGTSDLSN